MLPRYVVLEKPRGNTPLECVSLWREEARIPKEIPTSYAGRLDPMAEGKLLVLVGEECKRQKEYTKLDKEYVVEVLLGVHTDTGDVLGHPTVGPTTPFTRRQINRVLQAQRGTHHLPYPVFSSKTVAGKPLFVYALEGTLDTISIPTHDETFYSLRLLDVSEISAAAVRTRVMESLMLAPKSNEPSKALGADFRISTIVPAWEKSLATDQNFTVLRIRVRCGSGAYMRSLADRIGSALSTYGCALSIKRTEIGQYSRLGFWTKRYR